MSVNQTDFRTAILDPTIDAPAGLVDEKGRPAGKRFNVYRNNVAVSLTEALEVAFPVVRKLVGDEFFKGMAGVFLRHNPPKSPMMMLYGDKFPQFIRKFKPAQHLGYLSDVARLEQMLREAYHAGDADMLDPKVFQTLSTDDLMRSRLVLVPAARVLRSTWPIHAIWTFNTKENAPQPEMIGQDVLICRPEFDPMAKALPEGGADFIEGLQNNDSFAASLAKAKTLVPEFDLTTTLGALISGGALMELKQG